MCRPLTRRQFLRFAALASATVPLLRTERIFAQTLPRPAVPMNLELVTVTDTEAVVTWFTGDPADLDRFQRPRPVAAPGRVLIGESPDPRTWEVRGAHGPTPFHYVEISGLQPGRTYWWRAESNGIPAVPTSLSHEGLAAPPAFTTLVPPPGREIMRIAWLNDLHIGELVSGLAYSDPRLPRGGLPPGFPVDPHDPYWRTMAHAAVREARERGCRFMLVNGDLSDEAQPQYLEEAKATLDFFGTLGASRTITPSSPPAYFVTRGNHDRDHAGATWLACPPVAGHPGLRDCFLEVFGASFDPGTTHFSVAVEGGRARYRFVGLDSNDADRTGVWPQGALEYLEAELERGDATIPLFHHPVGDVSLLEGFPPGLAGMDLEDARAVRQVLARHENVVAVYNGHTHRNFRALATDTGRIPYFEGGAVKEYPGGFTTVRLYEGGIMVNFWKTKDPHARAWSEMSRGEYLGLYPYYTLGSLDDRNWVLHFDALAASAPAPPRVSSARQPAPGTRPSPLPRTGAPSAPVGALLAASASGAAALLARNTSRRKRMEDGKPPASS